MKRLLLLLLFLPGCVANGSLLNEEPAPAPEVGYAAELVWQDCPLFTDQSGAPWASCAVVDVPLDWEEPDGPTIPLFVKRYAAEGVDPLATRDAVWPLTGGPGGAGNLQESTAELLVANDPELTYYLLDHRGTGRSERLGCISEGIATPGGFTITLSELPSCAADVIDTWGDALDHFTTTNAAKDLAWLIEQTRADGQRVHVHGGSYGTRWLQRLLQVAPDAADSASGLGVVPPDFTFADYDTTYEVTGAAYLDLCATDPTCRGALGTNPFGRARLVLDGLDVGCPEALGLGLDRDRLRSFFGGLLLAGFDERVAIPALLHRLDRCDADDVDALRYFVENVPDPLDGLRDDRNFSRVLGNLIIASELWDGSVTASEGAAFLEESVFALGSSLRVASLADAGWPTYPLDGYAGEAPDVDLPVLWINGELDPATPLAPAADYLVDAFPAANQHLLVLRDGSHGWTSPTPDGYGCGLTAFWNFVRQPGTEIFDCAEDVVPTSFAGGPGIGQWLFGRDDLWGGSTGRR